MSLSIVRLTIFIFAHDLINIACGPSSATSVSPPASSTPPATSLNVSNANANANLYALDEPKPPSTKTVNVPANIMWFDSGIDLLENQKIMIIGEGKWSIGKYSSGPMGTIRDCKDCIVPNAYLGTLVAKIGNEAFVVGDHMQMPSPQTGRLYFSVNDVATRFKGNRSSIKVTIVYGPGRDKGCLNIWRQSFSEDSF